MYLNFSFSVANLIPDTECKSFRDYEHWLFQLANAVFLLGYIVPTTKYCILFMHACLIFGKKFPCEWKIIIIINTYSLKYFSGFMLFSTWAWRVMCAPDIFTWNLCFLCLNAFHLIYIIYQMRPISFDPELEEVYHTLFRPFKVKISSRFCVVPNYSEFSYDFLKTSTYSTGQSSSVQKAGLWTFCPNHVVTPGRSICYAKSHQNRSSSIIIEWKSQCFTGPSALASDSTVWIFRFAWIRK